MKNKKVKFYPVCKNIVHLRGSQNVTGELIEFPHTIAKYYYLIKLVYNFEFCEDKNILIVSISHNMDILCDKLSISRRFVFDKDIFNMNKFCLNFVENDIESIKKIFSNIKYWDYKFDSDAMNKK